MFIIEIAALENGAHRNQSKHGEIPEGWAVVEDVTKLENFPFGVPYVEDVDGVPTVTAWEPGYLPVPEPEEIPVTDSDVLNVLLGVSE